MDRDFGRGGASDFGGSGHAIEHGNSDNGDEGFFEIPDGFPSLMTLGAGFESMKIPRYKKRYTASPSVQSLWSLAALSKNFWD